MNSLWPLRMNTHRSGSTNIRWPSRRRWLRASAFNLSGAHKSLVRAAAAAPSSAIYGNLLSYFCAIPKSQFNFIYVSIWNCLANSKLLAQSLCLSVCRLNGTVDANGQQSPALSNPALFFAAAQLVIVAKGKCMVRLMATGLEFMFIAFRLVVWQINANWYQQPAPAICTALLKGSSAPP